MGRDWPDPEPGRDGTGRDWQNPDRDRDWPNPEPGRDGITGIYRNFDLEITNFGNKLNKLI